MGIKSHSTAAALAFGLLIMPPVCVVIDAIINSLAPRIRVATGAVDP